jgi:hypothetical protein
MTKRFFDWFVLFFVLFVYNCQEPYAMQYFPKFRGRLVLASIPQANNLKEYDFLAVLQSEYNPFRRRRSWTRLDKTGCGQCVDCREEADVLSKFTVTTRARALALAKELDGTKLLFAVEL